MERFIKLKKQDNKGQKIGEACSKEFLRVLKKNTKKIIFRENEIDERIGFVLHFFSIMEAVVATFFVKVLLDEIEVGGIILWLVLNVFVIAFFYVTQLVFGLINFLIVVIIRKEIKRFQFCFLSDVTISYADIVHAEGNELTYIDHGIVEYYRKHNINEMDEGTEKEGICKEQFVGRIMYYGKVSGRLLMLRGKGFKGRNVLYTVFEDEELKKKLMACEKDCVNSSYHRSFRGKKHYPDNYTRKAREDFYPHPNVVWLNKEKEILDTKQRKVSEKRYRKKRMFTWARRIGIGVVCFGGIFFVLLCMMLWDTGEISVNQYKQYTMGLLVSCLGLFFVIAIPVFIYGMITIRFTWRKQMLFAGWDTKDSNGAKIKVLKAYEYVDDKFVLHSFPADSLKCNFMYGEPIYCYGNEKTAKQYCFVRA